MFKSFKENFHLVVRASWVLVLILGVFLGFVKNKSHHNSEVGSQEQEAYRERRILASIEQQEVDHIVRFLKVQENNQIFLEAHILKERNKRSDKVIRQSFQESKEAHMDLGGQISNLFLQDLDLNGTWELLVPLFDEFLMPRLHILSWDSSHQAFEVRNPNQFKNDSLKTHPDTQNFSD